MTTALEALYGAVKARLLETPSGVWGDRVHPDLAPAGTARPHVVFAYAAGGEANRIVGRDAEIVLMISGYADTQAVAFALAADLSDRFNDADKSSTTPLDAGAEWWVLNVTQEQAIHTVELIKGVWVYREGHRFRFVMEGK